jgi:hypothetical protein
MSYLRTPFLCNGLCQARDTGLCQTVVRLTGISVRATCARDIDDDSLLAILDPEVGRSLSNQPEGGGVVDGEDGVPLLVGDLVDDAVPRVPGVVDDDMDLAIAKLRSLGHQHGEVVGVCHVTRDRDRPPRRSVVDGFGYRIGFCAIHVADDDFGALVREQSGGFLANALPGACDLLT